jgi:hypothetical protein
MWTVSHAPSGSFSERGISSAKCLGRLLTHRSSGSRKCESAELAQIFSIVVLLRSTRLEVVR